MAAIRLEGVRKSFGDLEVIKGVDLQIDEREFVVFVGPSGCGKSTLLRLVSGLEEVSEGKILIDGTEATGLPPAERGLSMVFQSYALYPHMTVRENMGFGLKMARVPASKITRKVEDAATILHLMDLLDRKPKALSGGQRQRVAIGRAIVREPKAFLFDEPLSNLDAALRIEMRIEIAKLHQSLDATMIYVTHDQVEAMTLADKIVVLNGGEVEQIGAPLDLYWRPANLFVARFIGAPQMNILECDTRSTDGKPVSVILSGREVLRLPGSPDPVMGGPVKLGIRPEHITFAEEGPGHFSGTVSVAEHLGGDSFIHVDVEGLGTVTVRAPGGTSAAVGDRVALRFAEEKCHLFDSDGLAARWHGMQATSIPESVRRPSQEP